MDPQKHLQDIQDHLQDLQDHLRDLPEHLQDHFQGGFRAVWGGKLAILAAPLGHADHVLKTALYKEPENPKQAIKHPSYSTFSALGLDLFVPRR